MPKHWHLYVRMHMHMYMRLRISGGDWDVLESFREGFERGLGGGWEGVQEEVRVAGGIRSFPLDVDINSDVLRMHLQPFVLHQLLSFLRACSHIIGSRRRWT